MTENRPEHETATMHINDPVADWCPHCAKATLLRHDITALVSDGPHRIGEYAVCHECGYSPYTTYTTPAAVADLREAVATAVYRHMPTAAEQPATTAYLILTEVMDALAPAMEDQLADGERRLREELEARDAERNEEIALRDADLARILGIVAEWVTTAAEYGGVDHGDLVDALEGAGYTLPPTDTKENDR